MSRKPADPWPRFLNRFVVNDSGCWIWTAGKSNGYGCVSYKGEGIGAHVLAYLLYKGDLPEGTEIDHLCENRACVNPDHLEAVTHRINSQRGNRKKRRPMCKRGHAMIAENILIRGDGTRCCRKCNSQRAYLFVKRKRELAKHG